jgi:hypothetical protein
MKGNPILKSKKAMKRETRWKRKTEKEHTILKEKMKQEMEEMERIRRHGNEILNVFFNDFF